MSNTPTISSRLISSVNDIPDGCTIQKSMEANDEEVDERSNGELRVAQAGW